MAGFELEEGTLERKGADAKDISAVKPRLEHVAKSYNPVARV